ncbi:MAG: ribose 5-phosphate isomerase B [Candidatus Calescibacterium sp.]|nr:ribose 5-phosphate isomerase B [Candidatus Calescibacterium sp.]MCX7972414.1 ribose 5-phosphate isomerase B [bacterium]MDW8195695.1 ribose 5-phosphate isomerase B [Candidatus Calescibacterium sp.]
MFSRVFLGSDHAGFNLKKIIIDYLVNNFDIEIVDKGTYSEASCDYPDYAIEVCKEIIRSKNSAGILICGTGIGMSIVANKFEGIRAALCYNSTSSRLSRLHNDSNILCLGARIIGPEIAKDIVKAFLETPFEGGRHQKRIDKILELEKKIRTC